MATKPRCTATTKKGTPCRATALRAGTEIGGVKVKGGYCRAHDPVLPAAVRFGSRAQAAGAGALGGAAGKKPRVVDILREKFEAESDEYLAALSRALEATEPRLVGYGDSAEIVYVPDHKTRLKALEMALNYSYGRPRQALEVTGEGGAPLIPPALPTGDDWDRDLRNVLRDLEPSSNGSNGNGNGRH